MSRLSLSLLCAVALAGLVFGLGWIALCGLFTLGGLVGLVTATAGTALAVVVS